MVHYKYENSIYFILVVKLLATVPFCHSANWTQLGPLGRTNLDQCFHFFDKYTNIVITQ